MIKMTKKKKTYKLKDIDIKNRICNFIDDMINSKNLDPNKIKIDEKSYKNISGQSQ